MHGQQGRELLLRKAIRQEVRFVNPFKTKVLSSLSFF